MAWSRVDWVKGKSALARRLTTGQCGGGYADAVIILASAVSAMAADRWPGAGIDRKRFVQLLSEHCNPRLHARRISVPLLLGSCRDTGKAAEEAMLRSRFMDFLPSQIVTGSLVDQDETAISACCPALSRSELRRFSYANLFYTEVRSALVHEYRFGSRADPVAMAENVAPDEVSYGNWWGEADRHIHFPIDWLCGVAETSVDSQNRPLIDSRKPAIKPGCSGR